jgi:hypothetical protein
MSEDSTGFKLNVDALRGTVFRGKKYKTVKSFGSERKANELYERLKGLMPSKRFPPVVESVSVGKIPILGIKLGRRYRVKIPYDVKLEI